MSYNRIDRISEEIKRELSEVLRELKDPRAAAMVSILDVRATKDLRYAKVLVSILGNEDEQKSTMAALKSASGFVRRELGHRMALRQVPEIIFELSQSIEHGIHISRLIDQSMKGVKREDE